MLRMGRSQVNITPYYPIELFGYFTYFEPTRVSTGIHSRLFARAIVLDDGEKRVALASCDLCEISYEIVEQAKQIIKKSTGITNVIIAMTHTHSGPAVCFGRGLGKIDSGYYNDLDWQISKAVIIANLEMNPIISVASGSVEVEGINKNRSAENGYIDKELSVLSLKTNDGVQDNHVVLCNFACHPVTQKRERCEREDGSYNLPDTKVSGDFPGVSSLLFEQMFNGNMMFFQGADGDLNPAVQYDQTGKTEEMALRFTIGVLDALAKSRNLPIDSCRLYFRQFPIKLDLIVPTAEEITRIAAEKRQQKHKGWVRFWNDWEISMLEKLKNNPKSYCEAEISVFAIGDCLMLFHPAELYSEFGRKIKDCSPFKHTFVVSNANGTVGYLSTEDPSDTKQNYSGEVAPAACNMFPYQSGQGRKLVETLIQAATEAGKAMGVNYFGKRTG